MLLPVVGWYLEERMFGCVLCVCLESFGKTWCFTIQKNWGREWYNSTKYTKWHLKGKNNESTSSGDDEGMTMICFKHLSYPISLQWWCTPDYFSESKKGSYLVNSNWYSKVYGWWTIQFSNWASFHIPTEVRTCFGTIWNHPNRLSPTFWITSACNSCKKRFTFRFLGTVPTSLGRADLLSEIQVPGIHQHTLWQTNIAGWNILIFNRKYIINVIKWAHFPGSYISLPECSSV